ncbi:MAG: hypothetical protein ABGX16_00985 [Pirellulales bacterium]
MTRYSNLPKNQDKKFRGYVALLPMVCLLLGCGDKIEVELSDYLEEIEFVAPLNSTVEVPLGEYSIPISVLPNDENQEVAIRWICMKFELHAVVTNENQSRVEAALSQNRGLYRDGVLKICRSATLDDVTHPNLTAIKLRLTDLSRTLLGKKDIRQLLCTSIITEAI